MLRNLSVLLLGCCLISVAAAQDAGAKKDEGAKADKAKSTELTDPTEILKKADEACKAVKFVKYTATAKPTGADESRLPGVNGTVIFKGLKNGRPEKFYYELKAKQSGSEETTHIIAGSDGNEFYVIDPSKKTAYVDIDQEVLGSIGHNVTPLITMGEYANDKPFDDEINGEKKELKGTTKVGDEECYEIYVKYTGQGQEANWFFSKKDFLPRRVERKFAAREGREASGRLLIVTSLSVDPKFDKDPFKFELPEGYTKSKDFAP